MFESSQDQIINMLYINVKSSKNRPPQDPIPIPHCRFKSSSLINWPYLNMGIPQKP